MVDLVPANTVLTIDQPSQVAPLYGLFRMETNATISASIDLTIKAGQAEFADGCVIAATGRLDGSSGAAGQTGERGGSGVGAMRSGSH
jgi:hypothetical protein